MLPSEWNESWKAWKGDISRISTDAHVRHDIPTNKIQIPYWCAPWQNCRVAYNQDIVDKHKQQQYFSRVLLEPWETDTIFCLLVQRNGG